jgi:hypothetical protein
VGANVGCHIAFRTEKSSNRLGSSRMTGDLRIWSCSAGLADVYGKAIPRHATAASRCYQRVISASLQALQLYDMALQVLILQCRLRRFP